MNLFSHRLAPILMVSTVLLLSSCQKKQDQEAQVDRVTIRATSMVCSSCVSAVKKAVTAVDGVKEVTVDLAAKTVDVSFIREKTNPGAIEAAITAAGYDANDKKRDPAAYEKLPACCKKPSAS